MNADSLRLSQLSMADKNTDERARLAALDSYCILDTQPDLICDLVTELATRLFKVEIALVSLVAENRQWFKSRQGLEASGTPRSQSFCAHAIEKNGLLIVPDASRDHRFADNPLVLSEPGIRFYVGASLVTPTGLRLGTLCIIGKSPREKFTVDDAVTLQRLAAIVMARLEILRENSYVDSLTKLPNRNHFFADLQALQGTPELRSSRNKLTAVAVDICDRSYLDDMVKALGWDYVEGFLIQAKEQIRLALGEMGLYRIGTTVFAFLEKNEDCLPRIEQIKQAFMENLNHQGIPHHLVISIGIVPLSRCEEDNEVVPALLTSTGVARERGTLHCHFDLPLGHVQKHSFELLSAIPGALLSTQEFELVYQPKISLISGKCVGVEALLRWHHPLHGVVSPSLFIPLAEKTALIRQVTLWVLQRGIEQAARWLKQGKAIPVAINVSARDFDNEEMILALGNLIEHHRIPPGLMEIEFTESGFSKNPEKLYEKIQNIKRLGVKVAIDDFGAGFSNLSYLKNIPADYLKIDQSFIRSMDSNYADQQIVPSMINLGQRLGFAVVAEGLETEKVQRILRHLGCDYGQGYGIAMPMSAEEAWSWVLVRG